MVNGINSTQSSITTTMIQGMTRKNPEDMFKQLSTDAGGDGTSITKDQLQTYVDKLKEEGKDTKPLDDILSNFDKISGGNDKIISSDIDTAMKNGTLKAPEKPSAKGNGSTTSSTNSSASASDASSSTTPTTQQLRTYLNKLQSDGYGDSDIAKKLQDAINGNTVTPSLTTSGIEQAINELKSEDIESKNVTPSATPKEEAHKGTIADIMI